MMDYVYFERDDGRVFRPLDHGLLLKSFSAPMPTPKVYRETVEGLDGDLDMTEWAGEVRYNTREVAVDFRDMSARMYNLLTNFLHGRKVKIFHSWDLDHYYYGRCEEADLKTERHVSDLDLTFICHPYRRAVLPTYVSQSFTGSGSIILSSARETVCPQITASAPMTLRDGNNIHSISASTVTIPTFLITDTPRTISVTGTGTLTFTWTDGVF